MSISLGPLYCMSPSFACRRGNWELALRVLGVMGRQRQRRLREAPGAPEGGVYSVGGVEPGETEKGVLAVGLNEGSNAPRPPAALSFGFLSLQRILKLLVSAGRLQQAWKVCDN